MTLQWHVLGIFEGAAMDATTRAVRDMYEQYPYPPGNAVVRVASSVRLLLSYVEQSRPAQGPLRALDAGCGRGIGTLGCATLQPDVHFTGVDVSRVALEEASAEAGKRGLGNVSFQEVDLMTLDNLEVPSGGFDVVYSSGVLHHLTDPRAGLQKLRKVLAPHGVLVLMVYAQHGRMPLTRVQRGAGLLMPKEASIADRLGPARALAEFMKEDILANTPWENTPEMDDVEFVDRCLNVNETSYTVASLWELMSEAGLRFIRWCEPDDWSVEKQFPEGDLRERAKALPELDQYRLLEQACWRPSFELVAAHEHNVPRRPLELKDVDGAALAVNPDVSFSLETRNLHGAQRIESLSFVLRRREAVTIPKGPFSTALLVLRDQNQPFTGDSLVKILGEEGIDGQVARTVALELLREEILYRPHATEV